MGLQIGKFKGPQHKTQAGLALFAVLWAVLLLGIITSQALSVGRGDLQLAKSAMAATKASVAAQGAVDAAVFALMGSTDIGWSLLVDGSLYGWRKDGVAFFFRVTAEAGRVDINNAPVGLLESIVQAVDKSGADPTAVAQAITAARGDFGTGQTTSIPFTSIYELAAVKGVSPLLLSRLRPVVTVYSGRSIPDPAFASAFVQAALGGTRQIAEPQETLPSSVFDNLSDAPALIRDGARSRQHRAAVYRIETVAVLSDGSAIGLQAIVRLSSGATEPYKLLAIEHSDWYRALLPKRN